MNDSPTDVGIPMPDPTNNMAPRNPDACPACRGFHGGVNDRIRCLVAHLPRTDGALVQENRALRLKVLELERELAPIRRLRAEVAALGPSWNEKLRR